MIGLITHIISQTLMRPYSFTTILLTLSILVQSSLAELPRSEPAAANMRADRLVQIDGLVAEGIERKLMPGCVVMVGRHGHIVYHKAFGHRQVEPEKLPMQLDTVFDMASITKPVATATSVMVLVERGQLRLRDRVTQYIPEFGNSGKKNITLTQLLTHQAGFVPDNAVNDYREGRTKAFENIYQLDTMYDPGKRFVYSDVGFILLDDLIERASGKNVHEFSQENLFRPLGMNETGYLPNDSLRTRAATTEQRDGNWIQGEVHDPRAWLMKGVAGHAGLFSTANDLAIYAQMMLNKGHYNGQRILSSATVELMSSAHQIIEGEKTSIRGLGWDKLTGYSSNRAENMSERAFGHGGFTGTVLWIDPKHDLFFIFLSNRLHPTKGVINRLAGRIATVAVSAIDDELAADETTVPANKTSRVEQVQTGIDRLAAADFELLQNQRIGLITNQTGIDANGESTIELLANSKDVNLVALFSPEHGLAGKLDQSQIGDSTERGLKVFSLYGETREPTATQLESIDTLVFDIQDIGCRFYTYISTMGLAMKAADRHGKRFVVLDRPNPVGGRYVGGPMLDAGRESFVAFHSMPVQHGMTVGELAAMFKSELHLDRLQLDIVRCDGWRREACFDATGLEWINPSPNMRNLNQAILYPAIGLWETTNLSVGRGTDTPFEIVGAPWISATEFATALNHANVPGVQFTPKSFTPASSKFAGKQCGGVQISITARDAFDSGKLGILFATVLRQLYPDAWKIDASMRLLGHEETLTTIKASAPSETILSNIAEELRGFLDRREKYLLY